VAFAVKKMDPTDEPFGRVPGEENEPDHAISPPAETVMARRCRSLTAQVLAVQAEVV